MVLLEEVNAKKNHRTKKMKKKEYFFSQHLTGNSISSYILVYKMETKVAIFLTNLVIGPFPIPLPNPKYHFHKHHSAISSNTFLESSLQSVHVYLILSVNELSVLPGVEFLGGCFYYGVASDDLKTYRAKKGTRCLDIFMYITCIINLKINWRNKIYNRSVL